MTLTPQGTEGGFLFTGVIPNSKISGSLGFDGMSLLCIRNQQSLIGVAVTLYCQAVFSGETSFFGNLAAGLTPLLAQPHKLQDRFPLSYL